MDKPENAHRNFPMLWLVASAVAGLLAFAAYFEICLLYTSPSPRD